MGGVLGGACIAGGVVWVGSGKVPSRWEESRDPTCLVRGDQGGVRRMVELEYCAGRTVGPFSIWPPRPPPGLVCNGSFDMYVCWDYAAPNVTARASCPWYLPWHRHGEVLFGPLCSDTTIPQLIYTPFCSSLSPGPLSGLVSPVCLTLAPSCTMPLPPSPHLRITGVLIVLLFLSLSIFGHLWSSWPN